MVHVTYGFLTKLRPDILAEKAILQQVLGEIVPTGQREDEDEELDQHQERQAQQEVLRQRILEIVAVPLCVPRPCVPMSLP